MANSGEEKDVGYERLIMLTDGIFAIAITLMALEIRVPEVEDSAGLGQAILDMLPQILIFVFSFIQVGTFWLAHQRIFRHIRRSDERFLGLCLFYLIVIAFIPVPSAALGRYGAEFSAVVFFALTLMLVEVTMFLVWEYASYQRRLLGDQVTPQQIGGIRWRIIVVGSVFALSIPLAFISPLLAMLSWLLMIPAQNMVNQHFAITTG